MQEASVLEGCTEFKLRILGRDPGVLASGLARRRPATNQTGTSEMALTLFANRRQDPSAPPSCPMPPLPMG